MAQPAAEQSLSTPAALPLTESVGWVVLTQGCRPEALARALNSILATSASPEEVLVVVNGPSAVEVPFGVRSVVFGANFGVPAGRNLGAREVGADIVFFLDDDARIRSTDVRSRTLEHFRADPRLAVVGFRIEDESGTSARRHIPRVGAAGAERSGEVATFLGGACAVRMSAFEDVGRFWDDLFYAHEELELAWRLAERGWHIRYDADVEVEHSGGDIGQHEEGWYFTGRNRVRVARRDLPWAIAVVHVSVWLVLGFRRAAGARSAYMRGWMAGWRDRIDRSPISWRTVWRLTRLGRPPVL